MPYRIPFAPTIWYPNHGQYAPKLDNQTWPRGAKGHSARVTKLVTFTTGVDPVQSRVSQMREHLAVQQMGLEVLAGVGCFAGAPFMLDSQL